MVNMVNPKYEKTNDPSEYDFVTEDGFFIYVGFEAWLHRKFRKKLGHMKDLIRAAFALVTKW